MNRRMTATDKSVRDHPQQAVVKDGTITVVMKVGRSTAGKYGFPVSEWEAAEHSPTFNENYNRHELISRHYRSRYGADYNTDPCQAERIIDSQIMAIKKALRQVSA